MAQHICDKGLTNYCEACERIVTERDIYAWDAVFETFKKGNPLQFESQDDAYSFFWEQGSPSRR